MVPTEALRRQLAGHGFERLRVVARGVDTRLFDPRKRSPELRRAWGATPDTPVLMHVGRLASEKNLGTLLAAHDAMRQQRPDLQLVWVGDGPARAELAARCPQAVFAGLRGGDDLAAHYASADLFLFPSLTETYGNVTPEAMASGLPVLAYDYAAASQLIDNGHNGLLAPFADETAFVGAALRLLADPAAAAAMGRAARATAEGQAWDRVVGQLEAVLLSAAGELAGNLRESASRTYCSPPPYPPASRV
jgi:glycosyltransferase involved in cell wall biosynthesis